MKKYLIIRGKQFELPNEVSFEKVNETKSTHIFFKYEDEVKFKALLFEIMDEFGIRRFGHDLGVVFGDCQIFSHTEDFPSDVKYVEK